MLKTINRKRKRVEDATEVRQLKKQVETLMEVIKAKETVANHDLRDEEYRKKFQASLEIDTLADLKPSKMKSWVYNLKRLTIQYPKNFTGDDIRSYIEPTVLDNLVIVMECRELDEGEEECNLRTEADPHKLMDKLVQLVERNRSDKNIQDVIDHEAKILISGYQRPNESHKWWLFSQKIGEFVKTSEEEPSDETLIRGIITALTKKESKVKRVLLKMESLNKPMRLNHYKNGTYEVFWRAVCKTLFHYEKIHEALTEFNETEEIATTSGSKWDARKPVSKEKEEPKSEPKQPIKKVKRPIAEQFCYTCGRKGHKREACRLRNHHPNINKESKPWSESQMGKTWKRLAYDSLPFFKQLKDGKVVDYSEPKTERKCKLLENNNLVPQDLSEMTLSKVNQSLMPSTNYGELAYLKGLMSPEDSSVEATIVMQRGHSTQMGGVETAEHPCMVLLDTGANPFDFVNHRIRDILRNYGVQEEECKHQVQVGQETYHINRKISVCLCFLNKLGGFKTYVKIKALILNIKQDVILGVKCIQKHKVLQNILFLHLCKQEDWEWMAKIQRWEHTASGVEDPNNPEPGADNPKVTIPGLNAMGGLIGNVEDLPTLVEGNEDLQRQQRELCQEYAMCFSSKLRPEAALLPPMELKVGDSWDCRDNKRPPRPQGRIKQEAIDAQVRDMQEAGVVRASEAPNYSQVHLTPKPDGSYRFCIDYRRLNAVTEGQTWPIPNIKEMVQRIGAHRPKYFAVLDLTKGYYQAPLSEGSRKFTAFITAKNLWEWCRVPMGLMGAPAYFQRMMSTVVLKGVLYDGCECYLDDIIVFGKSTDEYLGNLTKVLKRLRKFKLTANPKKTRLGLRQVEFVGHVIDDSGITFHRDRLQEIINFPRPTTKGELKRFLGIAAYVRDNCRNASGPTKPLHQMLTGYKIKNRNHQLRWTEETIGAFEEVKEMVNSAQKLFFMRDDAEEIHLYTDASQYGIGASLVQIVDNEEQVISLMSRTLNKTQCNWSTIEKECFAIVEALRKFEYLLRDVHFILHTDHKNLVHIRDTGSPKVLNWKMAIQEYDFECSYIQGEANEVADFMSRNMEGRIMEDEPEPDVVTRLADLKLEEHPKEESVGVATFLALQCQDIDVQPSEDQVRLMRSVHNAVIGHNGVETTVLRLKKAGHSWKYMRQMIDRYIKQCDVCQKSNSRTRSTYVAPFVTLKGSGLMQDRSIDFVGPLQEDANGYKFICVIIDSFSRWVELYPTKNNDAISAARALLDHFGRFGKPQSIRSDRGSEFTNELIHKFLEMLDIKHELSIANSHEENGVVEAANAEVRRYLNDFAYDRQLDTTSWSENLPIAQRIQNSMQKTLTGMAPLHILFGGGLDLSDQLIPRDCQNGEETNLDNESWQKWMSQRRLAIKQATELIQRQLKEHIDAQAERDTGKRTSYPVGSLVLQDYPPSSYGRKPNKQVLLRKGPFEVMCNDGQTYTLKDIVTQKLLPPCNVHLLRAFEYDKQRTDPVKVRLKDMSNMYIVEKVIRHVGNWKNKKNMKVIVKWDGYDGEYEEDFTNLQNNVLMHEYLRRQGLQKYIPRRFR